MQCLHPPKPQTCYVVRQLIEGLQRLENRKVIMHRVSRMRFYNCVLRLQNADLLMPVLAYTFSAEIPRRRVSSTMNEANEGLTSNNLFLAIFLVNLTLIILIILKIVPNMFGTAFFDFYSIFSIFAPENHF